MIAPTLLVGPACCQMSEARVSSQSQYFAGAAAGQRSHASDAERVILQRALIMVHR